MNQCFCDKPKSSTPVLTGYTAPRQPASHEVGGAGSYSPKSTPQPSDAMKGDLIGHASSPGMVDRVR